MNTQASEHLPLTSSQMQVAFRELLTCGHLIYSWTYNADFQLLDTNCDIPVLNTIFFHSDCPTYMKSHFEQNTTPVILGFYLGLIWCAVLEPLKLDDVTSYQYHVIGPVLNTELSSGAITQAIRDFSVDMSWRKGFTALLQGLPIVTTPLFFQYGIMLHYCITGEKISHSDIHFQTSDYAQECVSQGQPIAVTKDRHLTYRTEQALLQNVREGNLDFANALEKASQISNGLHISAKDPITHSIISCSSFVTLCVRAAIEGGLTPDTAYSLGDSYIQSLVNCTSLTDIGTINHAMYADFIQRVHKLKSNPTFSKQIQSCIDYIELHLEDDLSLNTLARRVGYTEYYFSRKFKQETGTSLKDYIKCARMERAKALLTTTDLSISEIATRLHYCSSSHFSEAFRETTGILPTDFRKETQRI